MEDMHSIFRRTGAQTWSVRFHVPRDRRFDVGKAYGTKSGHKADVVKTLGTTDRKEAMGRRPKALEAIRAEIDTKLQVIGLAPLDGGWKPDWAFAWDDEEKAVAEGLEVRRELAKASDREDEAEEFYTATSDGSIRSTTIRTSPRDRKESQLRDLIAEQLGELRDAGKPVGPHYDRFAAVAFGEETPLGSLLDRWEQERDRSVSKASRAMDKAAFNHFASYLAEHDSQWHASPITDVMKHLRAKALERLEPRVLGGFTEWLLGSAGLTAKTVGSRVSPLKMFWDWCIRKHIISGPNPWDGATRGLKQQAARQGNSRPKRREFSEAELLALLQADPDAGRRWTWGQAIRDLMPLALLTGARQNELCSLTVDKVVQVPGADLLGIAVLDEEAKTPNSIRRVPLHPLVRPIIERRLAAAIATGEPDAPLFPECKPGGTAGKRSYYFSKRFTEFRRDVLGAASDGLATFHSFRKCFGTFMRRAAVAGVSECQLSVTQKLMGHKPQTITETTYMEAEMPWPVYEAAILGMVDKGLPEKVLASLS